MINKRTVLFSFTIIFFALIVTTIFPKGILRTAGKKIVDADGKEVIFKGIGLGGWLVPEGYMFNMSGFANSPSQIKTKIIGVVGEANAEIIYNNFRKIFVTEADIDSIASWGFNNIRLPMHYELLTPRNEPYVYSEYGFEIIDSLVKWCKKNDIYLILDLHAAPGGQSAEPISDYDSRYPSLWESEENKARTIDLWREIASRYVNEETIAGYDLLNEPAWDLGAMNFDLRVLYMDITNAIRAVDTNHIVYIEGNWFATTFDGLTPTWDDNMVYSFHKYWSEVSTGSIQSYLTIRNNYNVPLWMSESGENSNSWFKDFVKLLNDNDIGWTWWTIKKIDAISPLASVSTAPQFQVLMNYWNGSASKPSVDYAMTALNLQIDKFKIQNCDVKEDVIDALMRRPSNNDTFPFKENAIPGTIYGVNFDYGNLGTAYNDVSPNNVGAGSYNNGWIYRNEGVDIEKCTDSFSNGYNVGWIETGEWLKYTVNVTQSGTYKIKFRVSASTSAGKMQLILDNNYLTSLIDVTATGGWQNWQTQQVENVQLTEGKHDLSIRFYFGGFNFNSMEFELTTVDVKHTEEPKIEFNLEQNYPNPFNPETKISFSVGEKSNVKLTIHNLLGEQIRVLENGIFKAGKHESKFDGKELSSGIYFIRLQANDYVKTIKTTLLK